MSPVTPLYTHTLCLQTDKHIVQLLYQHGRLKPADTTEAPKANPSTSTAAAAKPTSPPCSSTADTSAATTTINSSSSIAASPLSSVSASPVTGLTTYPAIPGLNAANAAATDAAAAEGGTGVVAGVKALLGGDSSVGQQQQQESEFLIPLLYRYAATVAPAAARCFNESTDSQRLHSNIAGSWE